MFLFDPQGLRPGSFSTMSTKPTKTTSWPALSSRLCSTSMELRDRLLYCIYGIAVAVAVLAIWPGPNGLIDFIAQPIRAHMPPDAKLIAVGVFSPFFVPLKVLMMVGMLAVLPWIMYQLWAFVAPGCTRMKRSLRCL